VPEGHTIHRLARDHRRWFAGHEVRVDSPQGRFADGAALLDGSPFDDAEAHGKHLFHHYAGGRVVHVHLGLFGRFFHHRAPVPDPRETARYRVRSADRAADLVGAIACELLTDAEVSAITSRLGPDPLRDDADPEHAWAALMRRSSPVGRALMDQKVISGIGNVYRAEVLHRHGVHPLLPARRLPRERWEAMWATLVAWMHEGVRRNRIVTVDTDAAHEDDQDGGARLTNIYRQPRCGVCDDEVVRIDLDGRWAYVCESCQPRPRDP
jgi:endonuclease VIII